MPLVGRSVTEMHAAKRRTAILIETHGVLTPRHRIAHEQTSPEMPVSIVAPLAVRLACQACGVRVEDAIGIGRKASYEMQHGRARRIACVVMARLCPGASLNEIAMRSGMTRHTVERGVRVGRMQMVEPGFALQVVSVEERIKERTSNAVSD